MKWITLISPKFVIAVVFVCAIFIGPVCLNLSYDLKKLLWQDELNPRVRCAFGNVLWFLQELFDHIVTNRKGTPAHPSRNGSHVSGF